MGALFAGLQGLIITVRRNAWSSVLTTIMLIIIIAAWSARDNIMTFIERNPSAAQEKDRFDRSVVADGQINDTLNQIRVRLNADRISIRQFHNSKTDLTGLPFASISTTYYALAPGIALSDGSLDPYPLSTVNELLSRMFIPGQEPKCVFMNTDEIRDPIFTQYSNENGDQLIYACPLMNLRGQPVGIIAAIYLTAEKTRPGDAEILGVINDTGLRVVGYLSGVIAEERKPWYDSILGDFGS